MRPLLHSFAVALTSLLAAGCLQASWVRESRFAPVPRAALNGFEAGRTDLDDCLSALGAPLWVWEHAEGGEPGAALAYGWFDERNFGLRASVPVAERVSVSFDYGQIDQRMQGVVLFFDEGWRLRSWRTGLLRDLSREARRPPAFVEDAALEEGA
ncbi:MAG: hypothetical protein HOP15_02720 [Planctomycetes bacterium]|nr:hypothetical protein [Planctomycetota bacterium]